MPANEIDNHEMIQLGLKLGGFQEHRNVSEDIKLRRFRQLYGLSPLSCCEIFRDIQIEELVGDCLIAKPCVASFLLTMRWLKAYSKEEELAGTFRLSEKTCRKYLWIITHAFHALKEAKIVWKWNEDEEDELDFLVSVDGTHCRINEPRKQTSSEWYSHKYHKAGLTYEIALDLHASKVVWVNGPFPAGQNDLTVFRKQGGLQSMVPPLKKIIADNGYQCQDEDALSTPNKYDTYEVKAFKKRARARHETFNKRIKDFGILTERFRHGVDKNQCVFEAVCVLIQYDIDNGLPLFML